MKPIILRIKLSFFAKASNNTRITGLFFEVPKERSRKERSRVKSAKLFLLSFILFMGSAYSMDITKQDFYPTDTHDVFNNLVLFVPEWMRISEANKALKKTKDKLEYLQSFVNNKKVDLKKFKELFHDILSYDFSPTQTNLSANIIEVFPEKVSVNDLNNFYTQKSFTKFTARVFLRQLIELNNPKIAKSVLKLYKYYYSEEQDLRSFFIHVIKYLPFPTEAGLIVFNEFNSIDTISSFKVIMESDTFGIPNSSDASQDEMKSNLIYVLFNLAALKNNNELTKKIYDCLSKNVPYLLKLLYVKCITNNSPGAERIIELTEKDRRNEKLELFDQLEILNH